MSRRGADYLDCKVYVGGLPPDATSQEVEDAFHRFGRIQFEDTRDAEDAVRSLDGARICGVRARVELSHGKRRNGGFGGSGASGGSGGGSGGRGGRRASRSRSRSRSPRRRSRTRSRSPAERGSPRYDERKSPRRSLSRSKSRSRSPPSDK
uniref:RRM domain-containing protein n=1 Tax=Steinernema glaseri TaxID=37863 RepID=A0A1I8AC49_9BILA